MISLFRRRDERIQAKGPVPAPPEKGKGFCALTVSIHMPLLTELGTADRARQFGGLDTACVQCPVDAFYAKPSGFR